ncbi:MAG: D-alanine transaminase [Candidatus Deianiraeaceae bacterium]|jgi:D-alanine transaminase
MEIYFNGQYCNINDAKVPITDRGYIFGDGIYEVFLVQNNKFIDFNAHIERLKRSLSVMNMEVEEFDNISEISHNLLKRNNRKNALMYIQITRGSLTTREHNMPYTQTPVVTIIPYPEREYNKEWHINGISCMLAEDIRWLRRDIKSLNLLGNIMLKQKALDCGFDDVIFYEKGSLVATEASSSNVLMMKEGTLITHPANNYILDGVVKNRILKIAKDLGVPCLEKEYIIDELFAASSVLLTNSGYKVRLCTSIDGKKINNGKPCKIGKTLFDAYESYVISQSL